MFKFIDLFAGIGGFHLAMHNAGAECVFASEWDPAARATYLHNFDMSAPELEASSDAMLAGDITQVAPELIPDFDILCGGFPCQPFARTGHKLGFGDTRGTLFFNIVDILKRKALSGKRPAAVFLENVRDLVTHDEGRTIEVIKAALVELGYHAPGGEFLHHVRSTDYGVPQGRERVFIIGFSDPAAADAFRMPAHLPLQITLAEIMGGTVSMSPDNPKERTVGFTLRVGGRGSGARDRHNWDTYVVDGRETRLTPAQGLRMQGFPSWYTFPPNVTEAQAMKQLGNSVTVPAVQAWGESIIRALEQTQK